MLRLPVTVQLPPGVDVGVVVGVGVGVVVGVGVGVGEVPDSSALARAMLTVVNPAAANTIPFGSKVAVCVLPRAMLQAAVAVQVPSAGLYSSALV